MEYFDPTPETPFLRSDCTGQCQQNDVGLPIKHRHSDMAGHGHSHNHNHTNETTWSSSRTLRSSSVAPSTSAISNEEYQNHNNTIREIEQRSESRLSTRSSISTASISKQRKKALERILAGADDERTDYTYSHSQTYASGHSPKFENPRLSRRSLSRHSSNATTIFNCPPPVVKSFWARFESLFWWRKTETMETTTTVSINNRLNFDLDDSLPNGDTFHFSEESIKDLNDSQVNSVKPLGSHMFSSIRYSYAFLVWTITSVLSAISYPIRKCSSYLYSFVKRDSDDVYFEETIDNDNVALVNGDGFISANNMQKDTMQDSNAAEWDSVRKKRGFACFGGYVCRCLPWLLLLLPLLLFLFYVPKDEQLTYFTIPPVISNLPYAVYMYGRNVISSSSTDRPQSIPLNPPPIIAQDPKILETLGQLQISLADLEKRISIIDVECCPKVDANLFLTRKHLDEVNSQYLSLKETLKLNEKNMKEDLDKKIGVMMAKMEAHSKDVQQIDRRIDNLLNSEFIGERPKISSELTLKDVNKMITLAVSKYDQDKTGMADHAFEPAGASVVSTRCSETYDAKTRVESIWGIPILSGGITPRTVIQPGLQVGECWAFKGSQGSLVIKLTGLIRLTSFTYEHISKAVAPDGNIESAPKIFEVWGLQNETDEKGTLLGSYDYEENGEALQNFPVQNTEAGPFPMAELKILRNHGHPVYTCLYRFRVHGQRIAPAYGYEP